MSDGRLFSVKMRASRGGDHVSGAERIVAAQAAPETAAALVRRALSHAKGEPDFIGVKVVQTKDVLRVKALPVATEEAATPREGLGIAARLLREAGVARADEVVAMMAGADPMRGAMLVDVDTLERLEPDRARGVRATCMDAAGAQGRLPASAKNHYAEAIVLASKVAAAPGIVAELCISDDPGYVTGYVASRTIGYRRITCMKELGDARGGRIFLCRGIAGDPAETIRFLEETPVLVEDIPVLGGTGKEERFEDIARELDAIREAGLWRETRVLDPHPGLVATVGGREVAVLSSNGYLGLADDPRVKQAAAEAARRFGAGTGGARLTTGTHPLHAELEARLAAFFGSEAAIAYATGYMANVGTLSALAGKGDVILSDKLNHASIIDGCRLSGADVVVYRHCDMGDLAGKLSLCGGYRRRVVASDGVFSMDGDVAPLPEILDLCARYDAFSFIDDAHAVGVLGATGRGTAEYFGCRRADITVGTLSKALGSEGGFVCASRRLADYLVNRSRAFIFSTSPAPAAVGAAIEALKILDAEPDLVGRLRTKTAFFTAELRRRGIAADTQSAIVPIAIGDEKKAVEIAARLLERGFLIPAIRYPTVARGKARLRVAISAAHDEATLATAAGEIAACFEN
ncbi:MAG: 8-amino-7-oxononanoate synthase [Kiritimatiellae bacterium]|nr:8-amino-7-oxononanoate synthase [Kiritimatiellia bacterium]